MLVYATPDQLKAWTGTDVPSNATQILRTASLLVRKATVLCFYATDDTGAPTDADIAQAFQDATCCHAAALASLDIDPNAGGVAEAGVESAVSIGSGRIQYADASAAADARVAALASLVPDAMQILADSGLHLTGTSPWVVG